MAKVMIDHTGITVSNFENSKEFYANSLAPFDYQLLREFNASVAGFGIDGNPDFWRDNGAPGLRIHYHPDYYGAFVLDPDGHNIEAVCHVHV